MQMSQAAIEGFNELVKILKMKWCKCIVSYYSLLQGPLFPINYLFKTFVKGICSYSIKTQDEISNSNIVLICSSYKFPVIRTDWRHNLIIHVIA